MITVMAVIARDVMAAIAREWFPYDYCDRWDY